MNFDHFSNDLDALIAYLDRVISSSVTSNPNTFSGSCDLIGIAQLARKHALMAKNGKNADSAFLQDLMRLCAVNTPLKPTQSVISEQLNKYKRTEMAGGMIPPDLSSIRTSDGAKILFGKCLGAGGEGSVYKLPAFPGKVAKIYHSHKTPQERVTMERKLRYLLDNKDLAIIGGTPVVALPEDILYFRDGTMAGYIMPQIITTTKLCEVQRGNRIRRLLPELDYRGMIAIAYNLAELIHHLHSRGIVVGDMNPNNILVQADGLVCMIDADSFDVTIPDTGERFPCAVGMTELLAPELQYFNSLKEADFTTESDCFSMAIHIFRLLMNNADPFGFQMADDTISKRIRYSTELASPASQIMNGESVYVRDIPGRTIPHWAPEMTALPEKIQELFRRTFGHTRETIAISIAQRPTAQEWMDALQEFYQMPLQRCRQDAFHLYLPTLTECPFCKKSNSEIKVPSIILDI